MRFIVCKMQHSLKRICRVIQCFSTVFFVILIIYVSLTSVETQWNAERGTWNVVTSVPTRATFSSNATREGSVPCPIGSFSLPGWKECIPWLNCSDISLQVHPIKRIGAGGITKIIWLADWKGYRVVFTECSTNHVRKRKCCQEGMTILEQIQGEFATRLIGKCTEKLQMVTMYYKHGSARFLDRLLRDGSRLSKYNNIQTRFQLSVDYVRIMDYLHHSPIGVRVQCDGATLYKLLSQYLITDDFHLILNDVDSLVEVTEDGGCDRRPNVSLSSQQRLERQGWPSESEPLKFNLRPTYDEKIEMWKLPWIVGRLLDNVKGSDFVKDQLREIMEWCHAINPQQRPTAGEILHELLRVQQLIVSNSSHIY